MRDKINFLLLTKQVYISGLKMKVKKIEKKIDESEVDLTDRVHWPM